MVEGGSDAGQIDAKTVHLDESSKSWDGVQIDANTCRQIDVKLTPCHKLSRHPPVMVDKTKSERPKLTS